MTTTTTVSVDLLAPAFHLSASSLSLDEVMKTCAAGTGADAKEFELFHLVPVTAERPLSERMACAVRGSRTCPAVPVGW